MRRLVVAKPAVLLKTQEPDTATPNTSSGLKITRSAKLVKSEDDDKLGRRTKAADTTILETGNKVDKSNKTSSHLATAVPAIAKFNPQEFVRTNATRNSYDICMIKKFIGKKILIPAKGVIITPKIKEDAKMIKAHLLTNTTPHESHHRHIILHVVCISGTMHIINGYSNYLAISAISYKDIEDNSVLRSTEIKLVQLPKVSNSEMRALLEYFN